VDRWGAVASVTTTVESAFGSRLLVEGFFLNNQLTDFAFKPVGPDGLPVANRVEPGKRPRSAMAPSIVFMPDGRFKLAVGSPGGPSIITFVAKALIGALDWNMTMDDAIELPNIVATSDQGVLLEDDAVAKALEAMGHSVTVRRITSGLQGIMAVYDDAAALSHYDGGADSRREGVALGD
jgi:gamma-glutamyltranspeptidase/glutathione hydrolase